jgi:hypothetical protein
MCSFGILKVGDVVDSNWSYLIDTAKPQLEGLVGA